ncbi:hypothetical protein PPACK8108_LOCUS12355 [Phakopsora pachyrhizi]|uniref:Tet-like 2OG-Fe(II) oxygenase domain-containing protein n=1 Tax=Phakopsora pachyrhizi TaxID=170000 RepID=A0AAV0B1N0_PHAPC|nr:hypothetical protein PPACK8108_LOCUS12355 [Phakopsora pachyrhizi]
MIVEFFPFEHMVEDRKKGWQDFVDFLLHLQKFINDLSKKNSSLISGTMYAEGWRKAQVPNQIVGRYINQTKLNYQVKKNELNQDEEAAGDLQVFIELTKVEGKTLVVLKTSELKHQTLPSKSTSDLFTRFGLSCQISKNMTKIMEKFHNHHYEGINNTFGNYDNYIKKANEK